MRSACIALSDDAQTLRALTRKETAFVEAYCGGANQTQAARIAGYGGSDAVLGSKASGIIRRPHVRAAIRAYFAQREQASVMSRDERERMLSEIARASGEFKGTSIAFRVRALELLARMNGDFATVLLPPRQPATQLPAEGDRPAIEGELAPVVTFYIPENGR